MTDIRIMTATPDDDKLLSILAKQAYLDHFPYLWTDGGVQYANVTFAVDQLRAELTDDNVRCLIARQSSRAVGYIKLNLRATLDDMIGLELHRIYLLATSAGRGPTVGASVAGDSYRSSATVRLA